MESVKLPNILLSYRIISVLSSRVDPNWYMEDSNLYLYHQNKGWLVLIGILRILRGWNKVSQLVNVNKKC